MRFLSISSIHNEVLNIQRVVHQGDKMGVTMGKCNVSGW